MGSAPGESALKAGVTLTHDLHLKLQKPLAFLFYSNSTWQCQTREY